MLLRRGPEHLPGSVVLLGMTVFLWLLSSLSALAFIDRFTENDLFLGLFSGMVGLSCYTGVLVLSGRSARILATLSAIIGTGALIMLMFVAQYALLTPIVGGTASGLIATVIVLWSVPVEGHIIARAIDRHWYVGVVIAVAVFIVQYTINQSLTSGLR